MDLLLGYPNTPANIALGKEAYVQDWRGDLQFDQNGQLMVVQNSDKLMQNVGKILLTQVGNSLINPDYGTALNSFVGLPYNDASTYAMMKQTILAALGYNVVQYSDSTILQEQIGTIETLSVMVNANDGSTLNIQAQLTDAAGNTLTVGIAIG